MKLRIILSGIAGIIINISPAFSLAVSEFPTEENVSPISYNFSSENELLNDDNFFNSSEEIENFDELNSSLINDNIREKIPSEGEKKLQDETSRILGETNKNPLILPTGESKSAVTPQALSLPSGEASISGMGESFQPLLTTGAASMSVPIALPPGRAGVQPSLAFSYLSTAGNGIMGIGWIVSIPFIARQTDKGMPRYDNRSLDRFIYNGGEEIVPVATPSETLDCRMSISFEIP